MQNEINPGSISLLTKDFTEKRYIEIVLSEHPELKVLWERKHKLRSPIVINGINPVLHIILEAIVEKQVQDEDPPEAKETLGRLVKEGFSRHAARAALTSLLIPFIFEVLKENKPFNIESYVNNMIMLGREIGKVGRNDRCPCGSGKKYKKCCEPFKDYLEVNQNAGTLILGQGAYAAREYLLCQTPESPVIQMENRHHIARYLAENGDLDGAVTVSKENIAYAERINDEELLNNALQDLEELCLDYKELSHEGEMVMAKLLSLAKTDEERGLCRCNRADMLAFARKVDEAEKEYQRLFSELPDWHFGRYRYAMFLDELGKTKEAIEVLQDLIAEGDRIDRETFDEARSLLEDLTELE